MARRIESLMLAGPAGELEALLEEPEDGDPNRIALVCHPHPLYGGTMHNKVVYRLARGLRSEGAVVLRFNYRGVSRSAGGYGEGIGEADDARAMLEWLRGRYPSMPAVLAGFSFGSRVVQRMGCGERGVEKLILAGFPASMLDAENYLRCSIPRVFVQSTRDEFGPVESMQRFYDRATGQRQLVWVEAGNHFFEGALDRLEEVVRSAARG